MKRLAVALGVLVLLLMAACGPSNSRGLDRIERQLSTLTDKVDALGAAVNRNGTSDRDEKCRAAAWTVSYSEDMEEIARAADYFGTYCTWDPTRRDMPIGKGGNP